MQHRQRISFQTAAGSSRPPRRQPGTGDRRDATGTAAAAATEVAASSAAASPATASAASSRCDGGRRRHLGIVEWT